MNKKISGFTPTLIMVAYSVLSIILIAGYVFIYRTVPFEGILNDTILNLLIAFAALFAAVVSTANFFHYQPEDRPRVVWLYLMLGCWFWFLSEATWDMLYFNLIEVPTPSVADVGWAAGYVFFAAAIYHQYVLVLPEIKNRIRNIVFGALAVVLVASFLVLSTMHVFTLENYVNYFYSFADLAVGIAGLMFIYLFRGGMLMRPWLGMFVFGASDFLYAWAVQTGIYRWPVDNGNLFTLFADSSYLFAYLFLTLGFVSQWILNNYGLREHQT